MDQGSPFVLFSRATPTVGTGLLYGAQPPTPLILLKPVKVYAHLWPILCKNADELICTCFAIVLEKSRP